MLVLWQQHQSTSYADTRYLRVINIYQYNVYCYYLRWLTRHQYVFLSHENQKLIPVIRDIFTRYILDLVLIIIFTTTFNLMYAINNFSLRLKRAILVSYCRFFNEKWLY